MRLGLDGHPDCFTTTASLHEYRHAIGSDPSKDENTVEMKFMNLTFIYLIKNI